MLDLCNMPELIETESPEKLKRELSEYEKIKDTDRKRMYVYYRKYPKDIRFFFKHLLHLKTSFAMQVSIMDNINIRLCLNAMEFRMLVI